MSGDDSFTDDDSFCNLYSTKRVTSTYNTLLEKLKSGGATRLADKKHESKNGNVVEKPRSKDEESEEVIVVADEIERDPVIREHAGFRRNARHRTARSTRNPNPIYVADDVTEREPTEVVQAERRTGNRRGKSMKSGNGADVEVVVLSDSEANEDVDPEVEDEMNYEVSVKVVWKSASVRTFRLRRFQKFTKIFESFMEEENVPMEKVFLTLQDRKIVPNDTPESLNLQVYQFVDGGILSDSTHVANKAVTNENCPADKDCIAVKVQDSSKKVLKFSIGKNEPLKLIMIRYAEQTDVPLSKVKFYFDGEPVKSTDTPDSLGLDSEEVIDVKIVQ